MMERRDTPVFMSIDLTEAEWRVLVVSVQKRMRQKQKQVERGRARTELMEVMKADVKKCWEMLVRLGA